MRGDTFTFSSMVESAPRSNKALRMSRDVAPEWDLSIKNPLIQIRAFLVQQPQDQWQALFMVDGCIQGRDSELIPIIDARGIGIDPLPQLVLGHAAKTCRHCHVFFARRVLTESLGDVRVGAVIACENGICP